MSDPSATERQRILDMGGSYFPSWSTAEYELAVIRDAFHQAVRAMVSGEPLPASVFSGNEVSVRDYFVSQARARVARGEGARPVVPSIIDDLTR